MDALTQFKKKSILFVLGALSPFYLNLPKTQAVSPAPSGGYGPPSYGAGNTGAGQQALLSLTSGTYNTALGLLSLGTVSEGNFNTGIGAGTLLTNTADENTATGAGALLSNSTGGGNTADGSFALFSNTTGTQNVAVGWHTLQSNAIGNYNTAVGFRSLVNNTADNNTAVGINTLIFNTQGSSNTACGGNSLQHNVNGSSNTATGFNALFNNSAGSNNTAVGAGALSGSPGDGNIALGQNAGQNTDGTFNILIGNEGVSAESNTIRIGTLFGQTNAYMSGVYTAQSTTRQVYVDVDGHLGTLASSRRYKEDIKAMDEDSEALFALKPTTFHYKKDPAGTRSFGLIAEEVAEVSPDLITCDEDGKPQTVRYETVNAMLLNEFLKEHRKVQGQQATIAQLKSTVARQQKNFQATAAHQQKQIEALTAGLEKVNAQFELTKPALQVVNNNQ